MFSMFDENKISNLAIVITINYLYLKLSIESRVTSSGYFRNL